MKSRPFFVGRLVLPAAALISFCGSASTSLAGNTWDGGGTTDNWSDTANWDSNTAPGYGTLTFSGSTRTTNIVDASTAQNQLLWTGTSTWTLNNSNSAVISLFDNGGTQAKIENQSTGLVTINAPITFAATTGAAWGEINAVNGDLTFGTGTLTVNGSAVNGIRMFGGSGKTTTFNNTVSASGKYFATIGSSQIVAIGGAFTSGDFYLMNGSTLKLNAGGTLTTSGGGTPALRLGGDFGTTGSQNLTTGATFQLTPLTGGLTTNALINTVGSNTSAALLIDSLNTSGTNTLAGDFYLDSNLRVNQAAGGNLVISDATTDIKAQTLTVTGGGNVNLSGVVGNSTGSGQLVIGVNGTSGGPAVTLSSANTYSGDTFVRAGSLQFTSTGSATNSAIRLGSTSGTAVDAAINLTTLTGGTTISCVINPVALVSGTTGTLSLNSNNTSGTNTLSGHIALDRGLTIIQAAGGTLSITQARANSTDTLTALDVKGNNLNIANSGTINISGDIYSSTGTGTINAGGAGSYNITGMVGTVGGNTENLVNTGTGTLTLSGAATSTLNTLRAANASGGTVIINGQTVTVANGSTFGGTGSNNTGKLDVQSGSVAFNGGLSTAATSSDGSLFKVSGGALTATSVTIAGRTNAIATAITAASTTAGFVVTAGTATISGNLALQTDTGAGSSVSGIVSGTGSLTVGGEIRLGTTSGAGRYNLLQVSGGTLTNNDTTTGGIVISRGSSTTAALGSLYLTGGTTTTNTITFGLNGGLAGGIGNLELSGGTLYIGTGGIVKAATNAFTSNINLTSGTLGAKAAWSSSLALNITGGTTAANAAVIKAADASDVAKNITLSGSLVNNGADRFIGFAGAGTTTAANLYLSEAQASNRLLTITGGGNVVLNNIADSAAGVTTGVTAGKGLTFASTFTGIATLANANTYTGPTILSAGNFVLGNKSAFGTSTVALNGASLSANANLNGAFAIANAFTMGGTNTFTGTNSLELSAAFTTASRTITSNITGGAFILSNSAINIGQNSATSATLTFNGTGNATVSGNLLDNVTGAGTSNVTYSGSGLLALSGANNFDGTLTATSGTTRIDNSLAAQNATVSIGAANAVTFGTGITSATFAGLSGAGDLALTNSSPANVNLSVGNGNVTSSYTGALSGGGSITKIGTGTLTVSNTSNAVAFTVSGGTLNGGGTTSFTNGGFGTGTITLQGGTLSSSMASGNTLSFVNALTVATGQTGTFNTPGKISWSGAVTGGGTLNVGVTTTTSRFDFNNDLTGFTGNLNLTGSGGVRLTNNGGSFNTASFQNLALDMGGSVNVQPQTNSSPGNTYAIGALSGTSATASLGGGSAGTATYSIGGRNTSTSFAGQITGNAALTKVGTATLTLTGTNTYTGATAISAGTLIAADIVASTTVAASSISADSTTDLLTLTGNTLVDGNKLIFGGTTVPTGLTAGTVYFVRDTSGNNFKVATTIGGTAIDLTTNGSSVTATRPGVLGSTNSAIVLGNAATTTNNSSVALLSNGAFNNERAITVANQATTGTYTIGGSNTTGTASYTGNITLNKAVTLQAATSGTVDFATGTWATNNNVVTVGSSGNTGTVQLSNALSTNGGVSVNFGTLSLNIANALGTSNTTPVTVNGGTLAIGANNQTAVGTVILSSGSITGSGGVLTSNATYDVRNGSVSAILGGSIGLTKTTGSAVTLSGANTYTGVTTVSAGTLQTTGSGTLGNANNGLTVNTGGTLDMAATSQGVGALNGTGGSILNGTASTTSTLTVGNNNATGGSYAGVIADNAGSGGVVALTKTGTGTQTLTGTNTYTGSTAVSLGKLIVGVFGVGGSITSNVTVASGATVGGSGTISGNMTLSGGGTLAAGNSPGVLTATGTTSFGSSSIFAWEIDTDTVTPGRGTEYDGLNTSAVSGSGAVFQIVTSDSEAFGDNFWESSHTWSNIFKSNDGSTALGNDWSTVFSSFAYSDSSGAISAPVSGSFSWTNSGNTLTFTAVPEPSSALAGLLVAAGFLRRRRAC